MKRIYSAILLFILISGSVLAQTWTQKASLPASTRTSHVQFTINNKIYIGLGYSGSTSNRFNDLWEYDPSTNNWTQKTNFPGTARYGAVAFVINNKAYVGTGGLGGGVQLSDFYEYDPATNLWTQKANFAGGNRDNAAGFSIGSKGYLCSGYSQNLGSVTNDLWEYDPALNNWVQKPSLPGPARNVPSALTINNEGYVGWGYASTIFNDVYKYNQTTNTWTTLSPSPANINFIFSASGILHMCSSTGQTYYYQTSSNQWINSNVSFPAASRYSEAGTEANGKGYIFGGGSTTGSFYNDFWEYSTGLCTGSISPDGPTTFCSGNYVNLTSDVVGGTYQWKKNGVNITTNGTSRTYKATATGSYTCVATCNGTALTSNAIQVTTKTNAFASVTASGATSFCLGDSVTLNCTNLGSNYSVQWYRTNISMENATNYSLVVKQPGTYKVVTKNLTTGCSRISGSAITTSVNCRVAGDITSGTTTEENTTNEARFTANDLSQGVNVFPNPNNGTFTFAYDGEETGDGILQIINTMGQSIYNSAVTIQEGGYTQEIQLGYNYNKGFYIVRLLINGSYHDSRVIVR